MNLLNHTSTQVIATAIALLFHAVAIVGIIIFKSHHIVELSALNLLLCFFLLLWTQQNKNVFFWLFTGITIVIGFVVETIGVNTGYLFGEYSYGQALGIKWKNVPLIIGINWFIVVYCCGISVTALLEAIVKPLPDTVDTPAPVLKNISVIVDGATLAVVLDWLMEPVAVKLGFWKWATGEIPLYNYLCWFVISLLLLMLFRFSPFEKRNKFAIHLLLIQGMFFLILRTFLP